MRLIMLTMAVATGLLIARLPAQHEQHQPQASPPAPQTDTKQASKMMSGGMMSQMPMMMMAQSETAKLVDELAKSLEAISEGIGAETDPAALKAKLAEHGALLKELQAKVQAQSHRMEMMQQMKGGQTK